MRGIQFSPREIAGAFRVTRPLKFTPSERRALHLEKVRKQSRLLAERRNREAKEKRRKRRENDAKKITRKVAN